MLLNNYLRLREKTLLPVLLIIFSFLVRIPIIIIFGDPTIENEWEPLLYNLVNHKTLSLQNFGEFLLPNLWLPPLYAYYLYLLSNFYNVKFCFIINTCIIQ